MSRFEALLDAARGRARPIVTTSIAMIGELISSTVLSLVRHWASLPMERSGAHAHTNPGKDPGHAYQA